MYVVNSYLHVLKNIDSSWGDSTSSAGSQSSTKSSRRRRSRTSTRSSHNSCRGSHAYGSSSESGLYSEELVNSGYYGDDEVDRCRCPKCLSEAQARKPKNDFAADYDIISVDLSACSTPKIETRYLPPIKQTNFDEYIIIPSSKEEFFAENLAHSTPIQQRKTDGFDVCMESPIAASHVSVNVQNPLNVHCSCKLLEEEDSGSTSPKPAVLHRAASNGTGSCWWRENIVWQLRQRNEAQTNRFLQLQSNTQRCRARVRINKELADYLNKYAEFRPHSDAASNNALINMEVDPLDRSELVLAIRNQKTSNNEMEEQTRVRSDSIAHLATAYLRRQRTLTEEKITESEESYSPGCAMPKPRMSSRAGRRDRVPSKKWRESIVNQLEMRNFLECTYFTDALARRTMSQLSVSENVPLPLPGRGMDEYDIITDDEVSSLDSRSTLMNSNHSTSQSQGYYSSPFSSRFFSFKRSKRK